MLKYFVYSLKWAEGECSKLYRWRVPGNLYQNYMYIYKFIKKRGQFIVCEACCYYQFGKIIQMNVVIHCVLQKEKKYIQKEV